MEGHPIVHIEIASSDPKAAGKFYSDLFGWKIEVDDRFNYVHGRAGTWRRVPGDWRRIVAEPCGRPVRQLQRH